MCVLLCSWLAQSPQGKIIECVYGPTWPTKLIDPEHGTILERTGGWKFMRYREDKLMANDLSVFRRIVQSIDTCPSQEDLVASEAEIKAHYRQRNPQPAPTTGPS